MNYLRSKTKFNVMAFVCAIILATIHFVQANSFQNKKEGINTETPEGKEPTRFQLHEAYGNLPLSFIENFGQMDEKVKYYPTQLNRKRINEI